MCRQSPYQKKPTNQFPSRRPILKASVFHVQPECIRLHEHVIVQDLLPTLVFSSWPSTPPSSLRLTARSGNNVISVSRKRSAGDSRDLSRVASDPAPKKSAALWLAKPTHSLALNDNQAIKRNFQSPLMEKVCTFMWNIEGQFAERKVLPFEWLQFRG